MEGLVEVFWPCLLCFLFLSLPVAAALYAYAGKRGTARWRAVMTLIVVVWLCVLGTYVWIIFFSGMPMID